MTHFIDINCTIFATDDDYAMVGYPDMRSLIEKHAASPSNAPVDVTVLIPPTYYELSNGIEDNIAINDLFIAHAGARNLRCFGVVEPKYGEHAFAEIDRIAKNGLAGIAWSPRAQGILGDDRLLGDLCRHAADRGLLSAIRTAPYSANESLWRIWEQGKNCPGIPLLVLGALTSWENIQFMQANAGGPDNILYDISGLFSSYDLDGLVNKIGAERLAFGSGGTETGDRTLDLIENAACAATAKQAIRFRNAAQILGLASTVSVQ